MLISEKIEQLSYRCKDARGSVAQYLLDHHADLESMNMQQIADATYTSKATLVRTAKALGYAGWNDFMKAWLHELEQKKKLYGDIDTNFPFAEGQSCTQIRESICQIYMESIYQTDHLIQDAALEKAARILDRSRRIGLLCIGANRSLSRIFIQKMLKVGKICDLCEQADMRYYVNVLDSQDCVIMISYSGNDASREPMNLIPLCKSRHIPIIALTGTQDSFLRKEADIVLPIYSRENVFTKIASYSSEISILFLFDLLYSVFFSLHYRMHYDYKVSSVRPIEISKEMLNEQGLITEQIQTENTNDGK